MSGAPPAYRSFREHRKLCRMTLKLRRELTVSEDKRWTRAYRLRKAHFIMSAAEAAWVLAEDPRLVARAIRSKALPATREELADGRWRWRILRSDLARFAVELEAAPSLAEEKRVEAMRLAEFEGRAGEPR